MTSSQGDLGGFVKTADGMPPGVPLRELQEAFAQRREEIEARLQGFRALWTQGSDEELFYELVFCLCTPQSSAAACDRAVRDLREEDFCLRATRSEINDVLNRYGVRFGVTKSGWIVQARDRFLKPPSSLRRALASLGGDPHGLRDWLQTEIAGLGFKEASHFVRNIGAGEDLAILDRHILTNLLRLGVIETIPKSLTRARYLEVEARVRTFALTSGIPMAQLDLLLWAMETGYVFK